jgi:glutamate/aspartate transport system permease protein
VNFDWKVFLEKPPFEGERYLDWLISGMGWTLAVGGTAWVIALVLGSLLGILRTVPDRRLSGIATAYVELFRNIPLLVQLFFWYFVFPELLPKNVGDSIKQMAPTLSQFLWGAVGLGLFTAARVCEQVRSGIQSLPKGQTNAGLAMGFTLGETYRFVLLPVAFRIVIPPLTSEFMNVFKNSSVVSLIGLLEITGEARRLLEFTAKSYESFTAATLAYFTINIIVMLLMGAIEKKTRLPGYLGGK